MASLDPKGMSQHELDDYLDELVAKGQEDSPEFRKAYEEWEARE
jgi:hypothetical protein